MLLRWVRFNAVGMLGAGVQLAVLWLATHAGVHYLWATAVAVEIAILHNFAWHRRWTWAGRPAPGALWRFHASNGAVSLVSNLVLMRVLTGSFGMAPVAANLYAILATSLLNFALSDRWVFAPSPRARRVCVKGPAKAHSVTVVAP